PSVAAPTVEPRHKYGLPVCRYDLPQRPPVVLDSTGNGKNAFAAARWDAGGVEHLHALFSGVVIGWIFLCARDNHAHWISEAGSFTHRGPASFLPLPAAFVCSQPRFSI